jgi:hypothetical protein
MLRIRVAIRHGSEVVATREQQSAKELDSVRPDRRLRSEGAFCCLYSSGNNCLVPLV